MAYKPLNTAQISELRQLVSAPSLSRDTKMALLTELHIDRLSVEDRLLLVEEIWDSIAQTPQAISLTEPQRHEIERRLQEHEQNPDDVVSWEAVKAATLARLSR